MLSHHRHTARTPRRAAGTHSVEGCTGFWRPEHLGHFDHRCGICIHVFVKQRPGNKQRLSVFCWDTSVGYDRCWSGVSCIPYSAATLVMGGMRSFKHDLKRHTPYRVGQTTSYESE
eukprot:1998075-Pyramimonas_sp.AAC.1